MKKQHMASWVFVAGLVVGTWASIYSAAAPAPGKTTDRPAMGQPKPAPHRNPLWDQVRSLEEKQKSDLGAINQQIADLRARHESTVRPLQQQLESLNTSYKNDLKALEDKREQVRRQDEQQVASIMDQIKPGYMSLSMPWLQSVTESKMQEDQALDQLRRQEESELQAVRERFAAQSKALREQYQSQRSAARKQFDDRVKALKS
jgi:Spy/CpxP family protein refolding chaperone